MAATTSSSSSSVFAPPIALCSPSFQMTSSQQHCPSEWLRLPSPNLRAGKRPKCRPPGRATPATRHSLAPSWRGCGRAMDSTPGASSRTPPRATRSAWRSSSRARAPPSPTVSSHFPLSAAVVGTPDHKHSLRFLPGCLPTLPRSRVASPAELLGRACSVARFWTSSADNKPDGDDGSDEAPRARPGDRVGCLAPNVHEVLITHYAVAALRGVVVNLNYRLSPPEMARETDVARGRGVGCERGVAGRGGECVGDVGRKWTEGCVWRREVAAAPQWLARGSGCRATQPATQRYSTATAASNGGDLASTQCTNGGTNTT